MTLRAGGCQYRYLQALEKIIMQMERLISKKAARENQGFNQARLSRVAKRSGRVEKINKSKQKKLQNNKVQLKKMITAVSLKEVVSRETNRRKK